MEQLFPGKAEDSIGTEHDGTEQGPVITTAMGGPQLWPSQLMDSQFEPWEDLMVAPFNLSECIKAYCQGILRI